jgi:hypothetical protein
LQIWCKLCELGLVRGQFSCTKHGNGKIAFRHIDSVAVMVIIKDGNIGKKIEAIFDLFLTYLYNCYGLDPVDSDTPTMIHISEHDDLLRWFDCADYMRKPIDIAMGGRKFFVYIFKVRSFNIVILVMENNVFQGYSQVVFVKGIGCENIKIFFQGFVKLKCGSPHHCLVELEPFLRNSLLLLHEETLLAAVIGLLQHVEGKLRSCESSKPRSDLLLSGDIESNPGPPR